jgi:multisubunit Na+/H+ antiporter MnhB subunit
VGRVLLCCSAALVLAALAFLLLALAPPLFTFAAPAGRPASGQQASERLREHFLHRGVEESGAINLVSAIYLGYRAFDTLGETIVLVLSVAGVLLVSGVKE